MKFHASLLALAVLLAATAAKPDCSQQFECLADYDPVCGSDGKTYSNECELDRAACDAIKNNSSTPTLAYKGECTAPAPTTVPTPTPTPTPSSKPTSCGVACPLLYRPVCGSDGTTYSNECFLKMTACKNPALDLVKTHDGQCECVKGCAKIVQQVCGSDGRTYDNKCLLANAACENSSLTVAHEGPCSLAFRTV